MKETKRYKLLSTVSEEHIVEASDGQWVRYEDYDYVWNLLLDQYEASEEEASMKAHLLRNSIKNNKMIAEISKENELLRDKIKKLESDEHIVETKSQDIEEAVQNYKKYIKKHARAIKNAMTNLNDVMEKIRDKHEKEI